MLRASLKSRPDQFSKLLRSFNSLWGVICLTLGHYWKYIQKLAERFLGSVFGLNHRKGKQHCGCPEFSQVEFSPSSPSIHSGTVGYKYSLTAAPLQFVAAQSSFLGGYVNPAQLGCALQKSQKANPILISQISPYRLRATPQAPTFWNHDFIPLERNLAVMTLGMRMRHQILFPANLAPNLSGRKPPCKVI